ncbi:helix-turn-helix domain-containing protein [Micromonospora humidisoli]|uniref:Helix-turn-helix domain-containing protein n=1 Tax=Micromonospora humidisoli TaxID=2807622 RepID=A0ABS2JGF6_9ACTN|nr:helix-turn-helix domain-containing protein [Micromonospora humidisoli]
MEPSGEDLPLREARRLLADPDRPISEIAARIGYHDPGYFTEDVSRNTEAHPNMAPHRPKIALIGQPPPNHRDRSPSYRS